MTRLTITGEYTTDWPAISLETRRDAGWRCVRCRHPFEADTGRPLPCDDPCDAMRGRSPKPGQYYEHDWETPGLNFGVHHLDGNKANNAWWNRLALCNSCHLSIQATVIPERPFMLPHSEWFIPYVCGYFAHVAGFEITREQAIADPDRWLKLGQPWLFAQAAP